MIIIFSMLLGVIYLISGIILRLSPPKSINYLYGYRTKLSMERLELWVEGNRFSSGMMIVAGINSMLVGLILGMIFPKPIVVIISMLYGLLQIPIVIFMTEARLKKLKETL